MADPLKGIGEILDEKKNVYDVYDDGLDYSCTTSPFATLERVVFKTNIVSITDDYKLFFTLIYRIWIITGFVKLWKNIIYYI